jgi:hypothetical protein
MKTAFDWWLGAAGVIAGVMTLVAAHGLGLQEVWVLIVGALPLVSACTSFVEAWPVLRQFGELLGRGTIVFLILVAQLEAGANSATLGGWLAVAGFAAATSSFTFAKARRADRREALASERRLRLSASSR